MVKNLAGLIECAKSGKRGRIAVAGAADLPVLEAVQAAAGAGIAEPLLVGERRGIEEMAGKAGLDVSRVEIIDVADPAGAAAKAVALVREGSAQILMKGFVSTEILLRAVLNKENGIPTGKLLSHAGIFESSWYPKLFCVTDAAMNIAPSLEEKAAILNNAVSLFHRLGEENPKVAVVAAVETVNPKMEPTVHAALLTQMNRRGQIRGCLVDGPLALDNAVSKEAAAHKGIASEVAGDMDIILVPDIEAGNILYKSLVFLGGACTAGIIIGAKAPIVLTSRSDSDKSKLYSIALAACAGTGAGT
ncbi:MAG: bifunctional enoyl-CoA hydratase/phosphate acetyltransferase [Spirochaetales bacterium]|jgi:phosphate butyryltransferase|nr:bifunctional enoyl-CoA hydratase/phosphate acetyltransferase [Spirochaetales bacterium]